MYSFLSSSELWAALLGAFVGGLMTLAAQWIALRAERRKRDADYKRAQQALGASLLFKVRRIHTDYLGVLSYIEESFTEAAKLGMHDDPWRFMLPLASLPSAVNFASDEIGMLLAQRDDDIFNKTIDADVHFNHFVQALAALQLLRRELMERVPPETVSGEQGRVVLPTEQYTVLRPRMIEVNALIEQLRKDAHQGVISAGSLLDQLQTLLRKRLKLPYKVGPIKE